MAFQIIPWGALRSNRSARNPETALREIKECGFTTSCFIDPKHVPFCHEVGLTPYVYVYLPKEVTPPTDTNPFYLSEDGRLNVWAVLNDRSAAPEEIERVMRVALEEVPQGPASVYLFDEPGAGHFKNIRIAADTIKKYRPELSSYINLFPNYAICGNEDMSQLHTESYEEYLDRYCQELGDVPLSLDNYSALIANDLQLPAETTRFFLNYVQAREACDKHGVEFHHVVDSNQLRAWLTIPTMSNLMLQAFTSLAAGARTVAWFTYFSRGYYYAPVNEFGEQDLRTPIWYWLKEVNRRLYSFGNALYSMPFKGMYFYGLDIPRGKSVEECPEITAFSADGPCMIGVYDYNGKPAVFVANCDVAHSNRINLELSGKPMLSFSTEIDRFIPHTLLVGENETPTWLAPGDAILLCEE